MAEDVGNIVRSIRVAVALNERVGGAAIAFYIAMQIAGGGGDE